MNNWRVNEMSVLNKIDVSSISEGVVFSAPVFFDDGENMFLSANNPAKHYHVMALKRWNIPYLLSSGHQIASSVSNDDGIEELEAL